MTIDVKCFGKITASKSVLNSISVLFKEAAELRELKGDEFETAKFYEEMSHQIFEELDKTGLYDKYR